MGSLRKFLALPASERWLVIQALGMVAIVRVALWVAPFQTVRRMMTRLSRGHRRGVNASDRSRDRITWSVRAVSRFVPHATCLTQSLAAQTMLQRAGYPADLRIGVALEDKNLHAHAWVESQGVILIGGANLDQFTPLAKFE